MKQEGRKEVHSKEKTLNNIPEKLNDFLTELRHKARKDIEDTASWRGKMATAANQRLGIKRYSNFPYEGAPDVPLPETDKLIKKSTPNLVLSSWAPKKMCLVRVAPGVKETPDIKARAKKAELGMNFLLRHKMDLYDKFELAADCAKEKGHCIFRTIEEFETRIIHKVVDLDDYPQEQVEQLKQATNDELKVFLYDRYGLDPEDDDDKKTCQDIIDQFRSGETEIHFDVEEISSLPNIEVPLPTSIIVPSYTTDLGKAYRITYEYFLSRHEIEDRMEKGIFIKKDLDDLEFEGDQSGSDDIITMNKQRTEGVTDSSSSIDLYKIHEICCWYKDEEGDQTERWVFTFFADLANAEDALLKQIPFPFEFGEWNYTRYDNERKDPRHYNSRGIPEQIKAVQETMERKLNNMLIRDEMNNNPVYQVLDTSQILQRDKYLAPGDMVPVTQLNSEIAPLNGPIQADVSSERILQLLKAYAEEYLGNVDQFFNNATNRGGGKTLGEIQEGMRQTAGPVNVEVIRWNEILSKVYRQVFDIMKDRLGEPIWVDGVQITKEDFNFPAEVKANGSLDVADKNLMTQKAWMRLQAIAQFMQLGVVNQEDLYNALKDWLEKDGVKDPDEFCTDPRQIMQTQLAQGQQQLQQMQAQEQQGQKMIEQQQKDIAKNEKKKKQIIKEFEGIMEAINEKGKAGK